MTVLSKTLSSSPLTAGDVVGLAEDLVYVPPSPTASPNGSPNGVAEIAEASHGVVGVPFTTFSYVVATDDEDQHASSSATPAVVRLYVGRVNDSPYLTVPSALTARLQDYQVADVDAWERGAGQLEVTLAADTLAHSHTQAVEPGGEKVRGR